jgi:hypothetical protein
MDKFEEKLKLAKVILTELEKGPVRRVYLLKRVIQSCGSPARFDSTFNWLKKTRRIRKAGSGHTDPYKITWKGERFLAGLVAEGER